LIEWHKSQLCLVCLINLSIRLSILRMHAAVSVYRFILFFIWFHNFFFSWLLNLRLLQVTNIILIHILLIFILVNAYTWFAILFYPWLAKIFLFFINKPEHIHSWQNHKHSHCKSKSDCCIVWSKYVMSESHSKTLGIIVGALKRLNPG
jgi:hypothetical protein